ncbi:hypothetical protein SAMN02744786_3512 [Stenotrophomonas sp. CC120222-04]|nr:hypothetical protein SAMN02744786_3512 [Stenotrophomonas sp. CC120222-04]
MAGSVKPGMAVPRENQLPLNDLIIALPPR